jgi:transposase-like protein
MQSCPYCQQSERQIRAGKTAAGSQRYKCLGCHRKYTPEPKHQGYAVAVRRQAVQWYVDGLNLRRIARHLGVNHQSVAKWVQAHAQQIPPAPVPASVEVAELDELYTFVGDKKTGSIL